MRTVPRGADRCGHAPAVHRERRRRRPRLRPGPGGGVPARCPGYLVNAMETGARAGDTEAVRRAAHTLKSNAATFGATALADRCRALESAAKDGDLAGADGDTQEIATLLEEVRVGTPRPRSLSRSAAVTGPEARGIRIRQQEPRPYRTTSAKDRDGRTDRRRAAPRVEGVAFGVRGAVPAPRRGRAALLREAHARPRGGRRAHGRDVRPGVRVAGFLPGHGSERRGVDLRDREAPAGPVLPRRHGRPRAPAASSGMPLARRWTRVDYERIEDLVDLAPIREALRRGDDDPARRPARGARAPGDRRTPLPRRWPSGWTAPRRRRGSA